MELGTFSKENSNGLKEELVLRVTSFLSISRSPEMATPALVRQMNGAYPSEFNAIVRMLLKNTDAWKAKRRQEIEQSIAEELKRREAPEVTTQIPKEFLVEPKVVTSEFHEEEKVRCDEKVFKKTNNGLLKNIKQDDAKSGGIEQQSKPADQSTEKVNKMTTPVVVTETRSALSDCSNTEGTLTRRRKAGENVPTEKSCAHSDCSKIGIQRCAGCRRSLYCGQV